MTQQQLKSSNKGSRNRKVMQIFHHIVHGKQASLKKEKI
jgi:hypothetical protein